MGTPWEFLVNHTFIGVTTEGDALPAIVKAGMVLTDAGLAFGDADTMSRWVNPTKSAWDDFDWIRYACQTANNEDEAISLLTTSGVENLHATGVSENLFVVGPRKTAVIEADARRYTTHEIPDVLVMSNYAKDLWRTQLVRSFPIANAFDAQKETWVRRGTVVHLGSVCGIKILAISPSSITARVFPIFVFPNSNLTKEITISVGERATIGPYSATMLQSNGNTAKVFVCTAEYAWEQAVLTEMQPNIGNITIQNMMNWSRFHATDLTGLRALCEDQNTYEAAMIFKIPMEHADLLSSGWFAANHACSSIYIPIHICDDDFFNAYETGDAASLSLALLQKYGHGTITSLCQNTENVFMMENELNEAVAHFMIHAGLNVTPFLTDCDSKMQEQAFLTEQLWLSSPNLSQGFIRDLWKQNYTVTQQNIQHAILSLRQIPGSETSCSLLENISQSISALSAVQKVMKSLFFR